MKVKDYFSTESGPCDLTKPPKEEYEKAKQQLIYFSDCVQLAIKRKNELLDELCLEHEAEREYRDIYDMYKEDWLISLAYKLHDQGFDFVSYYKTNIYLL